MTKTLIDLPEPFVLGNLFVGHLIYGCIESTERSGLSCSNNCREIPVLQMQL